VTRTPKLGKLAARHDGRTLRLSSYLASPARPVWAPAVCGYQQKVTDGAGWPMMLNDQLGDCTIAAAGHQIEQWTTYAGKQVIPTDAQILSAYSAVGGYVPGDSSTDNGCVVLDVLNYWRQVGIAGHKIAAYVSVNPLILSEVKIALDLFGSVYMGVQLPLTAQGASQWNVVLADFADAAAEPGSWGGHAIPMVSYGPNAHVVTWGELLLVTWPFISIYCDEMYAVLSQDWIDSALGSAPSGFNFGQLQSDLKLVTA